MMKQGDRLHFEPCDGTFCIPEQIGEVVMIFDDGTFACRLTTADGVGLKLICTPELIVSGCGTLEPLS